MLDFAVLAIFPGVMVFAAISDMLTMKIPNAVSLALVVGFFVLAAAMGMHWSTIGWHALAAVLMLIACFFMFNMGWIGGGDAKLAAATALWLGFGLLPTYGVFASVFGGILTLVILQLRQMAQEGPLSSTPWLARLREKNGGIPYGIALAAAGLMVYPDTALWIAARSI
ncbi:MAG TPA: prepilin peptidase [Rhodoblastus sp.]|mgnify:CR=1 FL=1|nr:prepilin peptidase [Rhodoblastus sp.]